MNLKSRAEANPDDLYSGLTPEEWDELHSIQTRCMLFKGIVAGETEWKQIIAKLKKQAQFVKELKDKGAYILDNCEGMILYHVPGYYGAYATYVKREKDYYYFKLHSGKVTSVPIDSQYDPLAETSIGSRIVVLLNSEYDVLNFSVSENQGSTQAKVRK
ncbi:MAG: hypothetical protein ACXADB_02265 [Candidatus Hermodarchaeia archaeon]|jgi:hypothetical protein